MSRFAYRETALNAAETVASPRFIRQFNTLTIYAGDDVAHLSDDVIREAIRFWESRSSGLAQIGNVLSAPGCAGSQAFLLQRLGLHTGRGAARYVPFLLEESRFFGAGRHFVLNPAGRATGTTAHSLVPLAVGGMGATGSLPPIANASVTRQISINRQGSSLETQTRPIMIATPDGNRRPLGSADDLQVAFAPNRGQTQSQVPATEVLILERVTDMTLSRANVAFPPNFTVILGEERDSR